MTMACNLSIQRETCKSESNLELVNTVNQCNDTDINKEACFEVSPRLWNVTVRVSVSAVFLGGSCNPTTWRQTTAIPFFAKRKINAYNPQVKVWRKELIYSENEAKACAEVMFFVIDNQTRAVSAMIEAAHVPGTKKKLILVIPELKGPECFQLGETITKSEFKELRGAQRCLQELIERKNIPIYRKLLDGLQGAENVLRPTSQVLLAKDTSKPVRMAHVLPEETLSFRKLREIFDTLVDEKSGRITLNDVSVAFELVTSHKLNAELFMTTIEAQNRHLRSPLNLKEVSITFEQFCCIMVEFLVPSRNSNNSSSTELLASEVLRVMEAKFYTSKELIDWCHQNPHPSVESEIKFRCERKDIFLGGSSDSSQWIQEIAIPLLKEHGLTSHSMEESPCNKGLVPLEAAYMDSCSVLLFVITGNTRAVSPMIMASHFIGQGRNVVLCIQNLNDDTVIDDEKLSEQSVKDYNRARLFLTDFAANASVPVFPDVAQAVEYAAKQCLVKT